MMLATPQSSTKDASMQLINLKLKSRELAARRQALEKKQSLREATAAEFGVLHLHTLRRTHRLLKQQQASAKARNEALIKQVENAKLNSLKVTASESSRELERARTLFSQKIEKIYPAWQERVQQEKVETLRTLEKARQEAFQRRLLAKQTFEKEVALNSLISQTRKDLSVSNNLERNEALERQLHRNRADRDNVQWDVAIREESENLQESLWLESVHSMKETAAKIRNEAILAVNQNDDDNLSPSSPVVVETPTTKKNDKVTEMTRELEKVTQELSTTTISSTEQLDESIQDETLAAVFDLEKDLNMSERLLVLNYILPKITSGFQARKLSSYESSSTNNNAAVEADIVQSIVAGKKPLVVEEEKVFVNILKDITRHSAIKLFPKAVYDGKMTQDKIRKAQGSMLVQEFWDTLVLHWKILIDEGLVKAQKHVIDCFTGILISDELKSERCSRKMRGFLLEVFDVEEVAKDDQKQGHHQNTVEQQKTPAPVKKVVQPITTSTTDVLAEMRSPVASTSLSQRVLRGGSLNDYSEFEDDVNLDQLIGTGSTSTKAVASSTSAVDEIKAEDNDDDEFDTDF